MGVRNASTNVTDFTPPTIGFPTIRYKRIAIFSEYIIKNATNKKYFISCNGRTNTFGDHPSPPVDSFIQNPIDIIYDLVRSELGHHAIDEAEYAEAKAAHLDWKFGFTVNKKINSKKLIEEIAKSTKCFPKFKNDGSFGFNTIKHKYSITSIFDTEPDMSKDYESATLIKESEVISYSFKRPNLNRFIKE